jgi:hypothetical protein
MPFPLPRLQRDMKTTLLTKSLVSSFRKSMIEWVRACVCVHE